MTIELHNDPRPAFSDEGFTFAPSKQLLAAIDAARLPGEQLPQVIERLSASKTPDGRKLARMIALEMKEHGAEIIRQQLDQSIPPGSPHRDEALNIMRAARNLTPQQQWEIVNFIGELYSSDKKTLREIVDLSMGLKSKLRPDKNPPVRHALDKILLAMRASRARSSLGENVSLQLNIIDDISPAATRRHAIALSEMLAMAENPVLQRLGESCFHKCAEAWQDGSLITPPSLAVDFYEKATFSMEPQVFVVQHDWAAVMANAEGVEDGEIHLPFDDTAFEFRISGRRVCLSFVKAVEEWRVLPCIETSQGWVLMNLYLQKPPLTYDPNDVDLLRAGNNPKLRNLLLFMLRHVHAVSVMLDAELAETEIIRAPYRLNEKRLRAGKLPIFDYHAVSLAKRARYTPRLPEEGDLETEHRRRRLHFVRSHVRRYENHTVRIKAHLRGDPDLGFIEKEYRL